MTTRECSEVSANSVRSGADSDDKSAGGLYSTSNDLISLGTAILNKSMLGSWATNKWLKPVSSTSTVGRGMGAPWEILRSTNLVSVQPYLEVFDISQS